VAIVVSDTSPLRALQVLSLVQLLEDMYREVIIPPQVAAELARPQRRFAAFDLHKWPFIRVERSQNIGLLAQIQTRQLDPGETEALALALEKSAVLLLIDERLGRRVATEMGLHPVGTLGILLQAKQQGLVAAIRPLINQLQVQIDFRLSPALTAEVLRIAGE